MVFGLNASAAMVIGLVGSAVGGLLPTLAALILGSGPQDVVAYRLALASVVALGLVAGLPVLKRFPHGEHALRAAAEETMKRAVSTRTLVRYALPYLLLGLGDGAFLPFQNLFFRQQFGLGDASVGVVLAWSSLGLGLGAVLGSPLSARIGMQRAATLLRLGSVPAMLLMLVRRFPPLWEGSSCVGCSWRPATRSTTR